MVINLNSCLGLLIPHDMDRSLYHATARCRLRPLARLYRYLRSAIGKADRIANTPEAIGVWLDTLGWIDIQDSQAT